MDDFYDLSIVIPCYGRHDLLAECLKSVDIDSSSRARVQIVLVDDGSEPPLASIASPHLWPHDVLFRQENRGRGAALREGLLRATGSHILIMDSDDEFLPGALEMILGHIRTTHSESDLVGHVYACFTPGRVPSRLPDGAVTNLLALRADLKVEGDLKEVVRRQAVLDALYPDPGAERRVPTSYIWSGVARNGVVRLHQDQVVMHRYLAGGMTHSIAALKRSNPLWLRRTYARVAFAPAGVYKSRAFRFGYLVRWLVAGGSREAGAEELKSALRLLPMGSFALAKAGAFVARLIR